MCLFEFVIRPYTSPMMELMGMVFVSSKSLNEGMSTLKSIQVLDLWDNLSLKKFKKRKIAKNRI